MNGPQALGLFEWRAADGLLRGLDARARDIFGCADDAEGLPLERLLPPADAAALRQAFAGVLRDGRAATLAGRVRRQDDGSERPVEFAVVPQADGRLAGVVADVSARGEADRRLVESEARYRLLFESLPVGVMTVRPDGRLHSFNDTAAAMLGYTREEFAQLHVDELDFAGDGGDAAERIGRIVAGPERRAYEVTYRHKEGHAVALLTSVQRVLIDGVWHAFGIGMDITAQRQYEQELRRQRMRLEVAVQAGQMGIWEWDLRRGEVHWSDGLYAMCGLPPGSGIEAPERFLGCVADEDLPMVRGRVEALLRGEAFLDVEHRIRRADGAVRWLLGKGNSLRDEDGELIGLVGVYLDITDRKNMETALREADRRKDEFLAMLGHELRNPLAPISNAVHLLSLDRGPQLREQALAIARRQLTQLQRIVDDLLEVGRINRGRIELKTESIALAAPLASAVETVRPLVDQRHQRLLLELPAEPVWLQADPTRLAQVFINLLNNASKYTQEGGRIVLRAATHDGWAVIEVADNGPGIAPSLLPQVFDLFTQGSQTLARSQGGLGIGLAVVRRLVEKHGGRVEAESPGPGRGTTFRVRLPVVAPPAEAQPAPAAHPEAEAAPAGALSVVVVDDNEDMAMTLAEVLRQHGHTVHTAADGVEGERLVLALKPHAAILDLGLPRRDGYSVARNLRQQPGLQALRLIALSGYGLPNDVEKARQAGFDRHLIKPATTAQLLQALA